VILNPQAQSLFGDPQKKQSQRLMTFEEADKSVGLEPVIGGSQLAKIWVFQSSVIGQ